MALKVDAAGGRYVVVVGARRLYADSITYAKCCENECSTESLHAFVDRGKVRFFTHGAAASMLKSMPFLERLGHRDAFHDGIRELTRAQAVEWCTQYGKEWHAFNIGHKLSHMDDVARNPEQWPVTAYGQEGMW